MRIRRLPRVKAWKIILWVNVGMLGIAAATAIASFVFLWWGGLLAHFPDPLDRYRAWWLYLPYRHVSAHVNSMIQLSAMAGILPVAVVGFLFANGPSRARSVLPLWGQTRWADRAAMEASGFHVTRDVVDGTAIILGREEASGDLITFPGLENIAVYAPTRTGKDISFVIPNCLAWGESLVVMDPKREDYDATAGFRAERGHAVYLFDPLAESRQTVRYNPLSYVERGNPEVCFDQIQQLGSTIFPDPSNPGQSGQFFAQAARSAWVGVACLVAETPRMPLTMASVLDFFTRADAAEAIREMVKKAREVDEPYTMACVRSLADYVSSAGGRTELYDSIRKSVTTKLALWQNPVVCAATETSDFDLRDLRKRRMTVYVAVSVADMERCEPLLALFFQQMVNLCCKTLPEHDPAVKFHVLGLLNEFATIGTLTHLAKSFAYCAGHWLRFAVVIQDPYQLDSLYGSSLAKTILDNCAAEIAFGTKNLGLAKELSDRVGHDTVTITSQSRPRFWAAWQWGRQSQSETPKGRALLLPQEVTRLSDTQQLIIRRGMMPIRARKIRWYQDRLFRGLRRRAPAVEPIEVIVARDDGAEVEPRKAGGGLKMKQGMDDDLQQMALSLRGM